MEVKKEPLAVKMEGTADNTANQGLEPTKSMATPGTKENSAPYKTPAAKMAVKNNAATPGFTPPSTGYISSLSLDTQELCKCLAHQPSKDKVHVHKFLSWAAAGEACVSCPHTSRDCVQEPSMYLFNVKSLDL